MTRVCTHCKTEKPETDYMPSRPKECRACHVERQRIARAKNPQPTRDAQARYRARHPEKVSAAKAKSRKGSRVTKYSHSPAYSAAQAAEAQRIAALPAWVREATENLIGLRAQKTARDGHAAWRARNPETIAQHNFFHNSKRRGVARTDSMLTWEQWQSMVGHFNGACAYCLRTDRPLTVDHIVPLSKGGEHSIENVVPACKSCNSKKHDRGILTMLGT